MKNILLVTIGLVIVFGISVAGYCQDLTNNLQLIIKSDKSIYKVGERIQVEIELKNIANNEIKVKDVAAETCKIESEPNVPLHLLTSYEMFSRKMEVRLIILKPQEKIKRMVTVDIEAENAGEYKLSVFYTMDKLNYINSNTIPIKIINGKILEVIIKSDKDTYGLNEPINIDVIIKNISADIAKPHICPYWLPSFKIQSDNLPSDPSPKAVMDMTLYSHPPLILQEGVINHKGLLLEFDPFEEKSVKPYDIYKLGWYQHQLKKKVDGRYDKVDVRKPLDSFINVGRYNISLSLSYIWTHGYGTHTYKIQSNPITIEVVEKK